MTARATPAAESATAESATAITAITAATAESVDKVEELYIKSKVECEKGASEAAVEAAEPYTLVNDLLQGNFRVMADLPREEALVFFRDVTTLSTLTAVLVGQVRARPQDLP